MMNNAKIGVALAGGYVLGRTKKAKLAIGLGMYLAGKKLNLDPRQLGKLVANSPVLGPLNDQVRRELVDATKSAATTALTQRMSGLADSLHERTLDLRDAGSGAEAGEPDAADESDGPEKADDTGRAEEAEPATRSKRPAKSAKASTSAKASSSSRPAKSAAGKASSGARKTTSGARKTASGARKTASGAARRKPASRKTSNRGGSDE
ncbi:hypothetical protein ACF05W_27730 [Streptomyces lydicus]|uniref:hypothetical protein n=1 Tax=Streptomyces lydicus TaxID=47763 RepID=UPI0036F59A42